MLPRKVKKTIHKERYVCSDDRKLMNDSLTYAPYTQEIMKKPSTTESFIIIIYIIYGI